LFFCFSENAFVRTEGRVKLDKDLHIKEGRKEGRRRRRRGRRGRR
jgi:hypothetical protein